MESLTPKPQEEWFSSGSFAGTFWSFRVHEVTERKRWLSEGSFPRKNTFVQVYEGFLWFPTDAATAGDPTNYDNMLDLPLGSKSSGESLVYT